MEMVIGVRNVRSWDLGRVFINLTRKTGHGPTYKCPGSHSLPLL